MSLKIKLIELSKNYEKMRKEAFNIVRTTKHKVKTISDAQIVNSLIEKQDFYWKHDLATIRELASEYKINISKLEIIWKKYIKIEQDLLKSKVKFEQIGLKNISFGPKTLLSASGDKKSSILIYHKKNNINIIICPELDEEWSEDFEKFAKELKTKIKYLTEKD